jgi:nucleoside 2-deoxyribosyltransferase
LERVYFAGPDVFFPDYPEHMARTAALAARLGFWPLFPGEIPAADPEEIVAQNLALIQGCDLVAANINPFRGSEPDSGTAFEMGYALALGKPVIGYLADHRSLLEKLARPAEGRPLSPLLADGSAAEDFGLPVNIMLAVPVRFLARSLEEGLAWGRKHLFPQPQFRNC